MLEESCLPALLVLVFGAAALSLLAAAAASALLVTGQLFGFLYWLWAVFREKVLGKKPGPTKKAKKQDYSIDQGKPAGQLTSSRKRGTRCA
ncbi:MAG: hypothetical protein PHF51_03590 [Candidatus ainarchaeum sp.]|nr:hypothetical protein [Candidatus ainarchaeum sp.]